MKWSNPSQRRGLSARVLCLTNLGALTVALAAGGCNNDTAATEGSSSTSASSTGEGPGTTTEVDPTGGPGSTSGGSTGGGSSTGSTGEAITSSTGSTGSTGEVGSTSSTGDDGSSSSTGGDTELPEEFVKVQIVALNDFHGNLEPPSGKITLPDMSKVDAGGAAFLATHIAALRADNPNTVLVSAGDVIGASPLVSALFHDEPTIEVMNQLGLAYNAVGNHEFDKGTAELLRMQSGGCSPIDGCADGTPFPGASFQFLAANVLVAQDPIKTLFPSYAVHEVGGVKIGFIGMTLEGTPGIVTPAGVAGLTFVDEVERANAVVPELTAQGVEAIVVLIHEGGYQAGTFDECVGISGAIVDIATNLSDKVDLVVSGHTHQAYNCIIGDKVVTSASSFGRVVSDIDLEISTLTGDVASVTAKNIVVTRDEADPDIESFVSQYKLLAAPLANKQIGSITATLEFLPVKDGPGHATMGLVVADAQLAATADPKFGGAQIAFMNPGGVRADLLYPAAPGEAKDGLVSYGEAFTVQPFGNSLVVMTLTGAQIEKLLEQQFTMAGNKVLQVSKGFTFAWSASAPLGAKVDPASIKLDGVTIDPVKNYRVVVNSFLASGGDSFAVLVDGTDRLGGATDLEALQAYFAAHSPVAPPALDRVALLP
jgi:5'-nucleotidase